MDYENFYKEALEGAKKKYNEALERAKKQDDDPVNPGHYKSYDPTVKIECIDAMRAAFGVKTVAGFCVANAFKYIFRHTSKGKNTDIKKAIWYLNKYLELGGAE